MTVPEIPPPTPEARMAYPRTPVQGFHSEPLEDLSAAVADSVSEGNARLAAAAPILEGPQGFGIDGYNVEEGSAHGWPTDMEPPAYETPLRPGPHA